MRAVRSAGIPARLSSALRRQQLRRIHNRAVCPTPFHWCAVDRHPDQGLGHPRNPGHRAHIVDTDDPCASRNRVCVDRGGSLKSL